MNQEMSSAILVTHTEEQNKAIIKYLLIFYKFLARLASTTSLGDSLSEQKPAKKVREEQDVWEPLRQDTDSGEI